MTKCNYQNERLSRASGWQFQQGSNAGTTQRQFTRNHLWLLAISAPLMAAPFWLSLSHFIPNALAPVSGLVLSLLLITSTVTDLADRKIYNWATYSAALWAILLSFATSSHSLTNLSVSQSMTGGACCFFAMLFPYTLARGGAGDVKLASAIGFLLGAETGIFAIALSYVFAGAFAAILFSKSLGPGKTASLIASKVASKALKPLFPWMQTLLPSQPVENSSTANSDSVRAAFARPIPLAPFFALGTFATLALGAA